MALKAKRRPTRFGLNWRERMAVRKARRSDRKLNGRPWLVDMEFSESMPAVTNDEALIEEEV